MDTDKLIKYITNEVMKRVSETPKENVNKDKVLAISLSKEDMSYINKDNFHIDNLEDMDDGCDITPYKYVVLGSITNKEVVNISLGLSNDKISSIVIDGIFQGKDIYLLREGIQYHRYKETSNIPFYNMMQGYEDNLKSFGINFVDKRDIDKLLIGDKVENSIPKEATKEVEEYILSKKIITETVIKDIYQRGYKDVVIDKNTKITPLAKDYIRTNSINLLTRTSE